MCTVKNFHNNLYRKCLTGVFVINPCQSTLTLVKFMDSVLHLAKMEKGDGEFIKVTNQDTENLSEKIIDFT